MGFFDDFKNLFDIDGNIRPNVWVEWTHEKNATRALPNMPNIG